MTKKTDKPKKEKKAKKSQAKKGNPIVDALPVADVKGVEELPTAPKTFNYAAAMKKFKAKNPATRATRASWGNKTMTITRDGEMKSSFKGNTSKYVPSADDLAAKDWVILG